MRVSSIPVSAPSDNAAPFEKGLLRVVLEATEGASPIVFIVEEARTVRTATSLRVRGTVIVETRGHRKVPLFDADLDFSFRQLRERTTIGVVSGSVDLPLPNFGMFNDVSLHQVPRAQLSVRLGSDLREILPDLEAEQPYLCFDHEAAAWAEGSQLSLRSDDGAPGVVVDPRDPAFYIRVETAALPGMRLLVGSWIGASASGWFFHDPADMDALWDQPGGRLTAAGIIDFEAVPLTLDGSLIVGTKPDQRGAKDERVVVFGGTGRIEAKIDCHALSGNTLQLEGASLSGDIAHESANLAVTGTLAPGSWPLTNLVRVGGKGSAKVRARVSSEPGTSTLECAGELVFHAERLADASNAKLGELSLEGAVLTVNAGEISVRGVTRAAFHPNIVASGPVSVQVELPKNSEIWRIVVRGDLRLGRRATPASQVEITASGMAAVGAVYRALG